MKNIYSVLLIFLFNLSLSAVYGQVTPLTEIQVTNDCQSITACFGVPVADTRDFTGYSLNFNFQEVSETSAMISSSSEVRTFNSGSARGICATVVTTFGNCNPVYFIPRLTITDASGGAVNFDQSGTVFPLTNVGFDDLNPTTITDGRIAFYPVLDTVITRGPLATQWEVVGPGGMVCYSGSFCGGEITLEYNEITARDEVNFIVAQDLANTFATFGLDPRDAFFTCTERSIVTSECIPVPVPTVGQWGLINLFIILAIVGIVTILGVQMKGKKVQV